MKNSDVTGLSSKALFNKLSDITRIVDPLEKKVIEFKNKDISVGVIHCFDFWDRGKVCDNCISMRAYNENITYVKIEYTLEKTYMVTAVPHNMEGKKVIIEILKDITNSLFFDSVEDENREPTDIHSLIDNMNKLAFSDPLTNLYNRRYIMEKLPVNLLNSVLASEEISIIMIDIDYFKNVNDTYGHLAGDQTLKSITQILKGCIQRKCDWIARFGGEEFLVCLPGANLDTVKEVAECMRKTIENAVIRYENKTFHVTASFGIYNLKSSESKSVDEMIKHADEKLYLAKKNGRNRIEY